MNSELGFGIALGLAGYAPIIPAMRDRLAAFVEKQEGAAGTMARAAHGAVMALIFIGIIILSYMAVASETFTPFVYGQF